MRNRFDRQLDLLNEELTAMGAMCEESIALVAKALSDGDLTHCGKGAQRKRNHRQYGA